MKERERGCRLRRPNAALDEPINVAALMTSLYQKLPDNVTIVDESLSRVVQPRRSVHRGGRLHRRDQRWWDRLASPRPSGWRSDARPQRRCRHRRWILPLIRYRRWTAARYQIPVVICILNNASYRILKGGLMTLSGRRRRGIVRAWVGHQPARN